ncbi:hypothetical protein L202_04818 [Cryptococcus amylolentus CBS 6039]|uniref:Uncharacterized protein n=1 Tax=Cryptococcus amylolentus CBS 6039 TaxID=1295533 RepID=A0A1E3HMU1_9TREE|nr:hypothetical protein L202_04818 [Cryptococcus amylolentus CBS 6039]ODN77667.1 hypothetical protein L202_04818 [Cryptococcus amylolentus CBS 6039]
MAILAGAVQPPLLTLLSSTSSPPLSPLFFQATNPSEPSSLISIVDDSEDAEDYPRDFTQTIVPRSKPRGSISHPVIHTQSPDPRTTYIQAGCSLESSRASHEHDDRYQPLGVELPWVGFQIKRLGQRDLSLEVGVVDAKGREGIIRLSSFKTEPSIHPCHTPPLIHLPLNFPPSESLVTPWLHIPLNLASLLPLFQSIPRDYTDNDGEQGGARKKRRAESELPSGSFKSVSFVKVYANCRVRRVWFSAEGEKTLASMGKGVEDEWALYAADSAASL